jgi:hypothetical protein
MSKEKGKRGPWSKEDKLFIAENHELLDYKDIAEHLERDPIYVKKYIEQKLGKTIRKGRTMVNAEYDIKKSQIWQELEQEFSASELRTFLYHWARIVGQFKEDVLPTEELQIIDMIKLELLMGRALRNQKHSMDIINECKKELDELNSEPIVTRDINRVEEVSRTLAFHRGAAESLTKEHNELLNRKMGLMKDLKGTRAERIKRIEDSKQTFVGWVTEIIQNKKLRLELGDYIEKMRIAIEVEKVRLMEPHKYMDGTMDCPLYTTETITYLDKQDKKEKAE